MWDGSFHTLEQQALGPFERGEMGIGVDQALQRVNSDPQYIHLFRAALGSFATADGLGRALASFQRTLVTRESRVDRFLANNDAATLSPLERDGYEIFTRRAGCANCHHLFPLMPDGRQSSRALFSDFQFHNLGVGYRAGRYDDAGRFELSNSPMSGVRFARRHCVTAQRRRPTCMTEASPRSKRWWNSTTEADGPILISRPYSDRCTSPPTRRRRWWPFYAPCPTRALSR